MFLGLANYFRDHIRNHSNYAAPLQKLIPDYNKRRDAQKVVDWTPEALDAFQKLKDMIQNCPKLFFLDDVSEIILYTDACSYGIGGYVAHRVRQQNE